MRVKARADYLRQLDVGRSDAAEVAADALTDLAAQREDAKAGMRAAEEALKATHRATSSDALLDFFNDLAARVRGSGGSEALDEVNARLRDGFEAVVLEALEDDDILAQPVLHPSLVAEWRGRYVAIVGGKRWTSNGGPRASAGRRTRHAPSTSCHGRGAHCAAGRGDYREP